MADSRKLVISRAILILLPFSILPISKNFWFHSDDWFWFRNYPNLEINLFETYGGLHFIFVPDLLFSTLIKVFSLNSFIYFELLLMAINAIILIITFEIVKFKSKFPEWIIVYFLCFWYTNPWGRENIRWPIAVSTNLSLLFTLLAIYLLIRKIKFPLVLVFILLAASLFSSSWGFAYTPLLIGAVLDSKYTTKERKVLIFLIITESLCTAYLLFQNINENISTQSLNIAKLIAITLSAPIVSIIAYTPYYFSWVAIFPIAIFSIFLFKIIVDYRTKVINFNFNFSFQFVGIVLSTIGFGFCVAIGRDSNNISVLLSSRFLFILGFFSILTILLGFRPVPYMIRFMLSNKLFLSLLLIVNFLILATALNSDIKREKWERTEFMKLVDLQKTHSGQIYPIISCCNMDPAISPQVLSKLLNVD